MRLLACSFFICTCFSFGFAQNQNVKLIAHLNDYSDYGYSDCWGYTAPEGREYALLGVNKGVSIVDVTDPKNIAEVVFVTFVEYSWYDMKTYQNYMYVSSEGTLSILIVDLSALPDSASIVGSFSGLTTTPHNIFIDTEMAILYAVEDFNDPTVRNFSLSDPLNPVEISTINFSIGGTDCHDIFAQDSVLYIAEGRSPSIGIFDMSNPGKPTLLTRLNIPTAGYVHQVWVTKDNKYMITTEETPGKTIKIWDIQDLNNIFFVSEYIGGSQLAHNAYFKGVFIYISHYESGLKILDFSDPYNVFETGFYDTFPLRESPGFNGAWGVYPFAGNGMIFVSDIQTGLYVVRFDKELGPQILVSPLSIEFGRIEVGKTSDPQTATIRNYGTGNIFISDISNPGSLFSLNRVSALPLVIPPGSAETFDVVFSPTSPGDIISTIGISSNDSDNPMTEITLAGEGFEISLAESGVCYASTGTKGGGILIAIDLKTGAGKVVRPTVLPSIPGLAINSNNQIYGSDGSDLYRIDAKTGETLIAGSTGLSTVDALAFGSNDVLYGIDATPPNFPLYVIDPNTGASTLLGFTGDNFVGLAFDPIDSTLWASTGGNAADPDAIYMIDTATGAATRVGTTGLGGATPDIVFDFNGNLFGTKGGDLSTNIFISINKVTGEGTEIGVIGFYDVSGLAIAPGIIETVSEKTDVPEIFFLNQNYPNPFNSATSIKYSLKEDAQLTLKVYNLLGHLMKTLVNEKQTAGVKKVVWNGTNENGTQVANGVYIYKIEANDFVQSKKLILLK